jgi:phosphoesterase RecJ-like protein
VRPDGDAIGSVLSMTHLLHRLGKKADPYCQDPVPTAYRFLPGAGLIGTRVLQPARYDVAILVDCGDFLRVGTGLAESIGQAPFLISIDHHIAHDSFGNIYWNDTSASSACEMLYGLCLSLPIALDADLATTLYTGLLADSGSFRFSNTNQRVLEMAANLVAAGADPAFIAEQVYDSTSVESLRLLATVKAVEMAMLFREGTDGKINVSMRSKGKADVASFAQRQGGGGHRHAAAFEVSGTLPAIRSRFTQEALTYLERMIWKR